MRENEPRGQDYGRKNHERADRDDGMQPPVRDVFHDEFARQTGAIKKKQQSDYGLDANGGKTCSDAVQGEPRRSADRRKHGQRERIKLKKPDVFAHWPVPCRRSIAGYGVPGHCEVT
jgi:hypothetical protein